MRLAGADSIRRIDQAAIERYGLPGAALMESAGQQAARHLLRRWPLRARAGVLVVCGRGNNGGDGFVVARHLAAAGVPVDVLLAGKVEELEGDAAAMASVWAKAGRRIDSASPGAISTTGHGVVVDALLGTGSSGAPRGEVGPAVEAIAQLKGRGERPRILALDLQIGRAHV